MTSKGRIYCAGCNEEKKEEVTDDLFFTEETSLNQLFDESDVEYHDAGE
jgi:hypothetical protein